VLSLAWQQHLTLLGSALSPTPICQILVLCLRRFFSFSLIIFFHIVKKKQIIGLGYIALYKSWVKIFFFSFEVGLIEFFFLLVLGSVAQQDPRELGPAANFTHSNYQDPTT
jgi:hypothetical protein